MKVERGPARLVKPSGPPPPSFPSSIPLSSSDLVVPRVHVEIIYAFKAPAPSVAALEEGLAKVISEYREWAGRLGKDENGRAMIDLNDEGVVFIEAEIDGALDEVMPFNPSPLLLDLVPVNRGVPELLLIQVTKFTCGGITIGVARQHQVADGEAASAFMNAWASIVKGIAIDPPKHDRSALMAKDPPEPKFEHIEYKKPPPKPESAVQPDYPPLSVKKLHFSVELLKKIKASATKEGDARGPSTFVSLTSHLWKCITQARGIDKEVQTRVLVAANGRKRLIPPISDDYFGNVIFHGCSQTTAKELLENPLSHATGLIQSSIKRIDNEYIRSALDFVELQQKNPVQIARSSRTVLSPNLSVTSWAQLPIYELDFGYGTPVFAGGPYVPFEGILIMLPSYTKDGSIDTVIGLFEPDMAKLEAICFDV